MLLRWQDPMMDSPLVSRLEEGLGSLGYVPLSWRGEFDGQLDRAVRKFQRAKGLKVDGIVGEKTWAALEKNLSEDYFGMALSEEVSVWMDDVRWNHAAPQGAGYTAMFFPTGVVLHQTAVKLSNNPSRWKSLQGHIGWKSDGRMVLVNDPSVFIWHAKDLSQKNLGIEISGNFEGVKGDKETWWAEGGGPDELTDVMLQHERKLFDWLVDVFKWFGHPWQNVYAHRQSTASREGDPGSEIWQKIGMVWCDRLREMGTKEPDGGPGWKVGRGKPIPREWDSSRAEDY